MIVYFSQKNGGEIRRQVIDDAGIMCTHSRSHKVYPLAIPIAITVTIGVCSDSNTVRFQINNIIAL